MTPSPWAAAWSRCREDSVLAGTFFGITSALAYTGANLALRQAANSSDVDWAIWISCWKSVPAAALAWMLVGHRAWRGLPALPPMRLVIPLLITGLLMQFGGNVSFQWALSLGGLALTVPLTFATLIGSGAILSRIVLGEPITLRSLAAIVVLIASIGVLSLGAEDATQSTMTGLNHSWTTVLGAILAASGAGIAYGACGVMIRRTVTGVEKVSLSATLVLLSTIGVVALGLTSWLRLGTARLLETTAPELLIMLTAGCLNAVAFFACGAALMRLSVIRVNLINASQAALCAAAGVLWFEEALTPWLVVGTILTMGGLMLMDRRTPPGPASDNQGISLAAALRSDPSHPTVLPSDTAHPTAYSLQPTAYSLQSKWVAPVASTGAAQRLERLGVGFRQAPVVGATGATQLQPTADSLQSKLRDETFLRHVEWHHELESTSNRALELAREPELACPALVLADRQTAGRGRGANQWWSAPGALTFSLVLDADQAQLKPERWPQVALAAGLALCEALEGFVPGAALEIKWPNDVMLSGKKLCGILCEVPSALKGRITLGIGINVNNSLATAPPELQQSATSLITRTNGPLDLAEVLIQVLKRMEIELSRLANERPDFAPRWRKRCWLSGRKVSIASGQAEIQGTCGGIDDEGALLVQTSQGIERILSGSVTAILDCRL